MTGLSQLWFDVTEREWGGSLIYRICFLETYNRIINSKDISDKTQTFRFNLGTTF